MSTSNPTPLQLGMTGTISGTRYRVVGRVVLGEIERGRTYYWNEFNLETDDGQEATLVYERTERGGEWRLFTLFEPREPITAEEAATKRVGQSVNLDGLEVPITLVGQSHVYFIEGKAPEGVEVGDVANYFNAGDANHMDVVSWTGQEVECYHGNDLPWVVVAAAFNLHLSSLSFQLQSPEGGYDSPRSRSKILVAVIAAIIPLAIFCSFLPSRRPPAIKRASAPPSHLVTGGTGKPRGTEFHIQRHALVEVARVGWRFERHEYSVVADSGDMALLVCGSKPGAKDWVLFTPLHPVDAMTPQQAGAVHLGQSVNIAGVTAKVDELFQSTLRRVEGPEAETPKGGEAWFCFGGRSDQTQLLVRWNASRIEFFEGTALTDDEVTSAFHPPPRLIHPPRSPIGERPPPPGDKQAFASGS